MPHESYIQSTFVELVNEYWHVIAIMSNLVDFYLIRANA